MASVPTSPVEDLRVSLEVDRKNAAERWDQADKALSRALREKKKEAAQQDPPRRRLPLQSDAAPPRERERERELELAERSELGASTSWIGSGSEEETDTLAARNSRLSAARDGAFEERARQMRRRADDSRLQSMQHEQRKLRAKVAHVLLEVKRRQELRQSQEKARQHREAVLREAGRGSLVSLGEASEKALGLPKAPQKVQEEKVSGPRSCEAARAAGVHPHVVVQAPLPRSARNQQNNKLQAAPPPGPSPRRVALVDSLTLEELDLLRRNALFFFDGPVLSALCNSTLEADLKEELAEVRSALEPLADFFTPERDEKDLPVSAYARRLRAQLAPREEQQQKGLGEASPSGSAVSGRGGSIESLQPPPSWDSSQRMPSQGRRPACREDHLSPTLKRVREVYQRRDAADAKWVAEREEAMVRREAINAFKASEQQREWQLEIFKQKELHKVRMLEAEERKAMLDSEQQERTERFEANKAERLRKAAEKADGAMEERRERATQTLDAWRNGVQRCERHWRDRERTAIERAETKWGNYMARLWALGVHKHDTTLESQCRKNDILKAKIQSSLHAQLRERQLSNSASLAEVVKNKQAAAAERRQKAKSSEYRFLEKAFGSEAARFDGKYHWGTTDRRSESWRRSQEAWNAQSRTFSEPALVMTR